MVRALRSLPFAYRRLRRRPVWGAATVEFALVLAVLLTLVLGIFEIGRLMLVWNSAVAATTLGARVAAVCALNSTAPAARMDAILPGLAASGAVQIEYLNKTGTACADTDTNPCYRVRASLDSSLLLQNFSTPLVSATLNLPPFSTSFSSEGLSSDPANTVCNP